MEKNEIIDLMKTNIEKMNFQQKMCFQMKNWTIVITIAIIGVAWKIDLSTRIFDCSIVISILIHLPLILFYYFFEKKIKDWMCYFIVFRERTKLLEKTVLENNNNINFEQIIVEYYKYHKRNLPEEDIDRTIIKKDFRKEVKDNFFIYLLVITAFSLIGLILYAKWG